MGLMYQFPANVKEREHIIRTPNSITLKTYGLPSIFWGYAAAIIGIVGAMYLAVRAPLTKLIELESNGIDTIIYYLMNLTFLAIPISILLYFFYEKNLTSKKNEITITHKFFGISVRTQRLELEENSPFYIDHFLDSPNMARLKSEDKMAGFQNKGYFELFARVKNQTPIKIDRHSRKTDLLKIIELLESVR